MPEALEPVDCPFEALYLWDYFMLINQRRQRDSMGIPQPISQAEVESWCRRRGIDFSPWENEVIDALEAVYMKHVLTSRKDKAA